MTTFTDAHGREREDNGRWAHKKHAESSLDALTIGPPVNPKWVLYDTRDQAVQAEIIDPIQASGADAHKEFDIEAIAAEAIGHAQGRFRSRLNDEEFWQVVERHARR